MSVRLGAVSAPSGALVLAMGGSVDDWPSLGAPLSARAAQLAETGGGHLRDWLDEAVAVPAAVGPLAVTALTRPAVSNRVDTIARLDVDLGLPWAAVSAGEAPVLLGDLPVDGCGMVIGDAVALDSWVGFMGQKRTIDGLADLTFSGKGHQAAQAHFGGDPVGQFNTFGWLDLPVDIAKQRRDEINRWAAAHGHYPHMAHVALHSHYHLAHRAGWSHPLGAGSIEVAGCPILFIAWHPGEHRMRFNGGRSYGQVYPVTLERVDDRTILRWTIPAAHPDE